MSSTKDAVATMGAILPDDAGGRDAVHVAVVSVVADSKLAPGQDVGLLTGVAPNGEHIASATAAEKIGIVDPFIKGTVWPTERFWLYLYPRTITALSHRWSHPAFPDAAPTGVYVPPSAKLDSEKWLRDFLTRSSFYLDYETMIAAASDDNGGTHSEPGEDGDYCYVRKETEYLMSGGHDAHGDIPPEFWDHIERVTGKTVKVRPTYFSCSC